MKGDLSVNPTAIHRAGNVPSPCCYPTETEVKDLVRRGLAFSETLSKAGNPHKRPSAKAQFFPISFRYQMKLLLGGSRSLTGRARLSRNLLRHLGFVAAARLRDRQ